MKKIKIDLIMENFLKEAAPTTKLFEPTKEGLEAFILEIKDKIKLPIVAPSRGSMYGPDELYITFGFEPKEKWKNGIFENSKYFRMTINYKGVMEVFSSNLYEKSKSPYKVYDSIPVKFRKTTAKTSTDAILKIQKFIKAIKDYYESIGTPLED